MRCWIGKEVEQNRNFGNLTLFIESRVINSDAIKRLIKIIRQNNISTDTTLYFGAHEADVIVLDSKDFGLLADFRKAIETSWISPMINYNLFDEVILRFSNKEGEANYPQVEKLSFKIRTPESVSVFYDTNATNTSLENLGTDGLFKDVDKIIYEE